MVLMGIGLGLIFGVVSYMLGKILFASDIELHLKLALGGLIIMALGILIASYAIPRE